MQNHIVQYQLFDVAFSNADKSYELQNKISDIFHSQLADGMERLFSRLVPEDTVLTLEEVNIDAGTIPYHSIEYDLVNRVLAELEREINYRLALIPSKNTSETSQEYKKVETSYADLLEYFLMTGAMPWWATGELLTDPLTVMEQLLAKNEDVLKQLIVKVGQYSYVRQRLVYQFSEAIIRRIISILEPAQATFIFDYHTTVVKTHRQQKLIEGAANTEFDKALWLFILTYILVDRGSLFNQKIFVRSTLGQMAQHYNRSYAEILALLTKALASFNLADVQQSNLGLIINELSVDEFDEESIAQLKFSNTETTAEDIVLQNLELVKHFLIFGSLPWWSEPYSEANIGAILLGLIKTIPKAVNKLIATAGQTEEVRQRITTVFDDEVIIEMVKLLEPANAGFIINYVTEVQVIHIKRPVVYTDGKDFKKAVWKFIFDFLLIERGSVFNERMFLESNIRKLASNYNVQYADMLMYLVQSIGEVRQASIEHAPLFQLLAGLLNDFNEKTTAYYDREAQYKLMHGKEPGKAIVDAQTRRTVVLKDVLLHWLTYGSIPWWGSEYFDQGPAAMFGALFSTAPAEAFAVLKYAGISPNTRKRVIYQLPVEVIIGLLSKQPGGNDAVKLYQYLLQAFAEISEVTASGASPNVLLLALWDVYIAGQYRTFDSLAFIQKGIDYLIKQHSIDKTAIAKALKTILKKADEIAYIKNLDSVNLNDDVEDVLLPDSFTRAVDIRKAIGDYLSVKAPTEQDIVDEVLRILAHFLTNNRLPSQFKSTNPAYVKAVIGHLLQYLKKTSAQAYKQLLLKEEGLKVYIPDEADKKVQIDGSIEQMISDYLLRDKQPQKDDVVEEALNILTQFLTTGKLPEAFGSVNGFEVLKQLLLLLNYARPASLNSILQRDGYLITARMQLHNVFAIAANTAEHNVRSVLKAHLEKDIGEYLKQLPGAILGTGESFMAMLDGYIKQSQGQHHLIIPLLKNQAAARYIARYYTDEQMQRLLSNNTALIGGGENLVWLTDLQLLVGSIGDTLQRTRLLVFLREFNLLVLGGHITVRGFAAYLTELLKFISSENYALFIVLADVMAKSGSTPGLSPAFTAKLSDVLIELNILKVATKAGQEIKQQLTKADDKALQNAASLNIAKQKSPEAKQLKEEIKQNQQLTEEILKNENKELLVNSKDTIYINNAGLVLLNPFFATYFVRLEMMDGGKFVTEAAQLRAVHLLQYLVDGSQNSPEHVLVLNKVLCNVPIEEPVPAEITLTRMEKEVSEELLRAVLHAWEKLRNTSVAGLRETFLQRDGALVFKEDEWHLTVQQRGVDVLLQTLPWNIGMIKAPWMDKFLHVEWA